MEPCGVAVFGFIARSELLLQLEVLVVTGSDLEHPPPRLRTWGWRDKLGMGALR